MDDLERILGYVDATDESGPLTKVGDELFVMSCWTPQFCSALIRAAEAAGGFSAQPGDPVPGHEISLALISPSLFEAVQDDMGLRIWPQLQRQWPLIDYHGINDVFIICKRQTQRHLRGCIVGFSAPKLYKCTIAGRLTLGVAKFGYASPWQHTDHEWRQVQPDDLV